MSQRVLLINYEYPPFGGGAANATRQLALALRKQGHSVSVLTASSGKACADDETVEVIAVNSRRRSYGQSNLIEMLSFLLRASYYAMRLKQARWDLAIVFFGIPCGPVATIFKWRFKIPYVVSLRGGDVPGFESQVTWAHRLITPLRRLVYRQSIAIVANSKSLEELSRRSDPDRVEIVPNGVDTEFFRPPISERQRTGLVTLLISNRFHKQKRIAETIELLSQARDEGLSFRLILVGEGPEEGAIREAVKKFNLEGHVMFKGWVQKEELMKIYQSADCFLSLSAYEGMPNSVLEAMASQLPVVLSDIAPHRELIQDNVSGFLIATDARSMFTGVLGRIQNKDQEVMEIARRARKITEDKYSWNEVAKSYLSFFSSNIRSSRPGDDR